MRIFDPVHGLIAFEGEDRHLQAVIDTAAFQRLRRVRQLGFSDLVYPGATNSRFAHSVGVFHNARRLLALMEGQLDARDKARRETSGNGRKHRRTFSPTQAKVAKLAALLHDVGHGPFSHAFEGALKRLGKEFNITMPNHESWSASIIRTDTDGLTKAIDELGSAWNVDDIGEQVASLLETKKQDTQHRNLYAEIVSSQFDADRLDYLMRDRRAAGVDIANFEADWLLNCLRIQEHGGRDRLVVARKGRLSVEAYLLARVQLHEMIYFHPTTRSFEKIFGEFVVHLGREVKKSRSKRLSGCLGHPLTEFLRKLVTSEPVEVSDYLPLDDASVWTLLSEVRRSGTEPLCSLANRLMERNPLPCLDLDPGPSDSNAIRRDRLVKDKGEKTAHRLGIEPWQCDFLPLRAYDRSEETGGADPEIYLQPAMEEPGTAAPPECAPIAEVSPLVRSLEGRNLFRIYFRDDAEEARVKALLREKGVADAAALHDLVFPPRLGRGRRAAPGVLQRAPPGAPRARP